MRCRLDLKNDPYRLVTIAATGSEHKVMDGLGHNGFIDIDIIPSPGQRTVSQNHIMALSDLHDWMEKHWGKDGWSPDSLRDIVVRLLDLNEIKPKKTKKLL